MQSHYSTESEQDLSPKEALFELTGQEDLIQSGYAGLFEESKTLPHYSEVHASWLETLESLNFGTPKISVSSVAEQRRTEQFFLELRHGDRAAAFRTHDSLLQARSNDEAFWKAVTDTLANRERPNNARSPLAFYLIHGWLYKFYWGMSNQHRELMLTRQYEIPVKSVAVGKKTIHRLGLKGWSNFPQTYSAAPILAKVYHRVG
jgi:hypothetical protein